MQGMQLWLASFFQNQRRSRMWDSSGNLKDGSHITYHNLGKYTEAEKLEIQVLNARNKILGEEHPDMVLAMGNLASTYRHLGKHTEAEELLIKVLDARSIILGEEHPATILAMGNLASTYGDLRKYTEAEKLEIQVLNAREKILGEKHPHTILAMEILASTYSHIRKYTEAEKLEIQLLDASSNILGGQYPDTIIAMRNLAAIQKAISQSMKVDNVETQVFSTGHGVSVTQGMKGRMWMLKFHMPVTEFWVKNQDDSDAVEAPANLLPTTNVDDRIIHSLWKERYLVDLLLAFTSSPFFQHWQENFKI